MTGARLATTTRSPFDPVFEDLPAILPLFLLDGVLLLPGGRLPLNIFEPRYLNMVRDALAGDGLIAIVQPRSLDGDVGSAEIYRTGCAGRIVSFNETDDGRYLITLSGLIRFAAGAELPPVGGYRRVEADFLPYCGDLSEDNRAIDRPRLLGALKSYFKVNGLQGDWAAIDEAGNEMLVTSLAMACPFAPPEKQALLEAKTLSDRAVTMTTILELSALDRAQDGAAARH